MTALEATVRLMFDDGQRARPVQQIAAELEARRRDLEDGIAAAAAELVAVNRMLGIASEPVTLQGGMKLAPLAPVPPDGGPPPAPASEHEEPSTPGDAVLPTSHDADGAAQDEPPPEDEAALEAPEDASEPAPADASPAATDDASRSTGAERPDQSPINDETVLAAIAFCEENETPATVAAICRVLGRKAKGRPHRTIAAIVATLIDQGAIQPGDRFKRGLTYSVAPAGATRRGDPDDTSPEDPEPTGAPHRGAAGQRLVDAQTRTPPPEPEPSPVDALARREPLSAAQAIAIEQQRSKPPSAAAPDDASPPVEPTPTGEGYDRPFEERCWCSEKEHPRCPRHHPERSRPAVAPRDGYQQPTTAGDVLALLSLSGNPMPLASIAEALSQPRSSVELALRKLVAAGDVILDRTTRRYEVNRYA